MSDQLGQSTMSTLQTQKVWTYFIWAYFALAGIFFFLLDARNLPDYDAYAGIFISPESISEPLFAYLNNFFRNAGLTYEQFRLLLLVFSLGGLLALILSVQKFTTYPNGFALNIITATTVIYVLSVFIFEFFAIRIRSGLAIAFFGIAIAALSTQKKHWLLWLISFTLFFSALFIHKATAVILTLVFGITASPLLSRLRYFSGVRWISGQIALFFANALVGVFLLLLVLTQNQVRSGIVISNLNPVRLAALGLIPLAIYAMRSMLLRRTRFQPPFKNTWVKSFENFYVVLAIELLLLYVFGLIGGSGEAIVRFYTLLSFPALIGLICAGSIVAAPICAYLLLANASFFLATLNMWPGFILEIMRWFGKS